MHYLGLALYAEGPTDYSFLCPLLERLCEDLCTDEAVQPVEISAVLPLNHPTVLNDAPREQRILAAAKEARGAWGVLFVHADGAGNPARARDQQIQPAIDGLRSVLAQEGEGVAVIPVRETEAWALVDGDALRRVFGTTLLDGALGLPQSANAVEAATDPKASLTSAFSATNPTERRRKQGVAPLLNALGEEVSLSRLRRLAAFASLESELRLALRQLRILP
jgi:hypothetical protein